MGISKAAQELGKRGGQTTASRHGKKHFSDAGKKGMARRWSQNSKTKTPAPDEDTENTEK
jgi:general stress protein YciG